MKIKLLFLYGKKFMGILFIGSLLLVTLQLILGLAIQDGMDMPISSLRDIYFMFGVFIVPVFYLKLVFFEQNNKINEITYSNFISKKFLDNIKLVIMVFGTSVFGLFGQLVPIYFATQLEGITDTSSYLLIFFNSLLLYAVYGLLYGSLFQFFLSIQVKESIGLMIYIFCSFILPRLITQLLVIPNDLLQKFLVKIPFYSIGEMINMNKLLWVECTIIIVFSLFVVKFSEYYSSSD